MDKKFDGIWAVIFYDNKGYLGKVVSTMQVNSYGDIVKSEGDVVTKEDVLIATRVKLNPVYDFFSPLRPVQTKDPAGNPMIGFSRDPIVTPFDFTVHDTPLYVGVGGVAFFDEMHQDDQRLYQSFVTQAEKAQLKMRAERSGITLPDSNGNNAPQLLR
jgi:hypothetical protein